MFAIFVLVAIYFTSLYYLIVSKVCPQPLVLDHHHEEKDGKDDREADEDNLAKMKT